MGESWEELLQRRGKAAGAQQQRGLLQEPPHPFPLGRWETGTVSARSRVLWVPQPFQHAVAGGIFCLAHGVETLVRTVSKRVTLVTSAWDMLEVGKPCGTSVLALGLQQAQGGGVQAGSVTLSPACDTVSRFSQGRGKLVPKDHALEPQTATSSCTGIWIPSHWDLDPVNPGDVGFRDFCPAHPTRWPSPCPTWPWPSPPRTGQTPAGRGW